MRISRTANGWIVIPDAECQYERMHVFRTATEVGEHMKVACRKEEDALWVKSKAKEKADVV